MLVKKMHDKLLLLILNIFMYIKTFLNIHVLIEYLFQGESYVICELNEDLIIKSLENFGLIFSIFNDIKLYM